jgi:uncharacterized protein YaaW (UPF0174 family)
MDFSRWISKRTLGLSRGRGKFVLTVLFLVIGPLRPAHAYIDPNVAGPLYQMLLPMLIAIGSAIAMVRRYIRHFWDRSIAAVGSLFRTRAAREENDTPQP